MSKYFRHPLAAMLTMLALSTGLAFGQAGKDPLAVTPVKPMPSLQKATLAAGKTLSLERVLESLDGQLIDRVDATRKFQLVARSDFKELLNAQSFDASGNVKADTAAKIGEIAGAKYLLVTSVDDFADVSEKVTFPGISQTGTRRLIRLGAVAKIWDSSTGKLLGSANFQHRIETNYTDRPNSVADGKETDEFLLTISREMSEKIAVRIADVLFPVKVLVKRDKQITINRGEGSGVEEDQIWNVFAVGKNMIDEDTKEDLGPEEVFIGKAKIISVTPKFSTAELLEDKGVDKGAILRLPTPKKAPTP